MELNFFEGFSSIKPQHITLPHKRAPHTSERRTCGRPPTKNENTATVKKGIQIFRYATYFACLYAVFEHVRELCPGSPQLLQRRDLCPFTVVWSMFKRKSRCFDVTKDFRCNKPFPSFTDKEPLCCTRVFGALRRLLRESLAFRNDEFSA